MWTLAFAVAAAAEPSRPLQVVTGAGLVVGTAGAGLMGLGLSFYGDPEPFGLIFFGTPGLVLLSTGSVAAVGGSLGQAVRLDAPKVAGIAGAALIVAGATTFGVGAALGTDAGSGTALFGAPILAVGGLVAAGVQGGANRRHANGPEVTVLPDPRGRGLVLAGTF